VAVARDPVWYSDVQYLTWDESMAAPEGRHAAVSSERKVFLQPPTENLVVDTNRLDDAGTSIGRGSDLVSACRLQIDRIAQKAAEQASRCYAACAETFHRQDDEVAASRIAARCSSATPR
jgi:hypothetical protein